jgi:hypothetical protein
MSSSNSALVTFGLSRTTLVMWVKAALAADLVLGGWDSKGKLKRKELKKLQELQSPKNKMKFTKKYFLSTFHLLSFSMQFLPEVPLGSSIIVFFFKSSSIRSASLF